MVKVVGVRFKKAGKIYYFDPGELDIEKDSSVIIETARGIEYGQVVISNREVPEEAIVAPLKKVIRVATEKDIQQSTDNQKKEKQAFEICGQKIREHKLGMKLIDVEYTFDNNKILFYFTAEGRIDFRELVKDLATIFKTRIELRQIGVRDETKMLGGTGFCGRELCCSSYLGEFEPVSIKMAKEQSLSINPAKISGTCGRLMCCLKYEHEVYEDKIKKVPKVGAVVNTPEGQGMVMSINLLKEIVKVKLDNDEQTDLRIYNADEVKVTRDVWVEENDADLEELKHLED
ncbi:MAG TPA: stage 0 sporulation protein [Clostridiales bacterium]|nr:stage 0 sporulation protein [Clostridiales bacterium]